MTSFSVENNAESTLVDDPLLAGSTTMNLATGGGDNLPSTFPFRLTLWDETTYPDPSDDPGMEIVECTNRIGDVLTIARAMEDTTAFEHAVDSRVALLITAGHFDDATYGIHPRLEDLEDATAPDNVYYVSPTFTENEDAHLFNSIESANEYVLANMPSYPVFATIVVYPGKYTESITNAHYRIIITGTTDTTYYLKSAILYNTGVDAEHYPIKCTGTGILNLINMTVMVDTGECFGALPNLRVNNCSFRDGYFAEYTGSGNRNLEFNNCNLKGNAFELTGATDNRFIALRQCDLYGGTLDFGSTNATGTKSVKIERCLCSSDIKIAGDWNVIGYLGELYGSGEFEFNTTGSISFDKVLLPNGINFLSDPAGSKSIIDCNFLNSTIASDHRDVSATCTITDVVYSGNVQQNGICDCIQIRDPEKNVGVGSIDCYYDLQSAVSSIPAGSVGTVHLWESLTGLAEVTLPNANTEITVDGQKKYSLEFTADIVEIGADRKVSFINMVNLTGGNIQLNGANAEVGFESCQYIVGYVTLTVGTFAIVYKSSLFGSTGHQAINIDNVDTIVVVGYSRIQGATGQPAVTFNAEADNKFKGKFSSFIHGDKTTSDPITTTVAAVTVSIYHCAGNANLTPPASIPNDISSAGNVYDSNINF